MLPLVWKSSAWVFMLLWNKFRTLFKNILMIVVLFCFVWNKLGNSEMRMEGWFWRPNIQLLFAHLADDYFLWSWWLVSLILVNERDTFNVIFKANNVLRLCQVSEVRIPKAGLTKFTDLKVNICKIVFGVRSLYDCTTFWFSFISGHT